MSQQMPEKTPSTVLLVDHDPKALVHARQVLADAGFVVEEAEDGVQVLERFEQLAPDIVLLNVDLPKLDAFELCGRISQMASEANAPALVLMGLEDEVSINRAFEVGATDFVVKPVNWPIISHRIRHILRARKAFNDIRAAEEKVRHLAYFDGLTGLPNRELFKEHLAQAITVAQRQEWRVAVLYMDLDEFKRINDILGYSAGDALLVTVGKRLLQSIRESDRVTHGAVPGGGHQAARFGGDEFIVVLTIAHEADDVAKVALRIKNALAQPVLLDEQEVFVTSSIGIALYPDDGEAVDTLLKNADAAMHEAKRAGKNRYRFYTQSMNAHALRRLTMESKLHKALENGEFWLSYQPQMDARSGEIVGMEALLRWDNPELGTVSPFEFISIVENNGLIVEIGEWVLKTACAQAQAWQNAGFPRLRLGVNLSPRQFQKNRLISMVKEALHSTGFSAQYLELELTENLLMRHLDETIEMLDMLCDMGITLSVDDFGTGYSSLNYLKRFPLTTLKIDRSFVNGIPGDADDMAITKAIIAMAHSLKLRVIAEGVEDEQQLAYLCEQGCDEFQGFFFYKPLSAQEFTCALERQKLILGSRQPKKQP